ncbi:hypothetical protein FOA43_001993 [Brettanomyces nanus]|uniref:DNA helicase n=1 Tax=Eeniella nana TaxID=13502 RepID=A0A875RYQ1_EENNA|nr:uncharacterized protein FOA43_001993 [Brettanomyces nanus]QPG74661.1 hypothetical protein FOA43_001993 [Brettanomyces nanus]
MENTFLILDESPSMGDVFDDAVNYLIDLIISKVARGKKKDLVGIITVHDSTTSNPMNDRNPEEWLNCVIEEPKLFNWELLGKLYRDRFRLNPTNPGDCEADLPRALAIALQYIADLNGNKRRKSAIHSIILVSNLDAECSWDGLIEPICSLALQYDVLIGIVYFTKGGSQDSNPSFLTYQNNLESFTRLISILQKQSASIKGRVHESFVCSFDKAKDYLRDYRMEPPKRITPVRTFNGEIRLCCDLNSIDLQNTLGDLRNLNDISDYMPKYDKWKDPFSLSFMADGYPLTKDDVVNLTQDVGVNEEDSHFRVFPIHHVREHYVEEQTEDDTISTKVIHDYALQKGYRYGSSIIPATSAIERQLEMLTYSGIDIISFTKKSQIPPWYYRGETILLIPTKDSSKKDLYAFNQLAQSMLSSGTLAIARVVQRTGRPAVLAALIPNVILTKNTKYYLKKEDGSLKRTISQMESDEPKHYYGFSMVKLFFKEDEKIPILGKVSGLSEEEDGDKNYPTREMVACMEKLVDAMDIDELNGIDDKKVTENLYIELNDFDTLPIPWKMGIDQESSFKSLNKVTRQILSQNSPKTHFLQKVLKTVYHYQLEDAQEGDNLYDLVEKSKNGVVTEDEKTFFDLICEELCKTHDFIPHFGPEVEMEELKIFETDKVEKKVIIKEEVKEDELKSVEELLGYQA